MARDRKRSKQRQQRRAKRRPVAPASQPLRDTVAGGIIPPVPEVEPIPPDEAAVEEAPGADGHDAPPLDPDVVEFNDQEKLEAEAADGGAGGRGGGDAGAVAVPGVPGGRAPAARTVKQSLPARAVGFLRASWAELQRVQWPDRRQVAQGTGVVLGFVLVAGAFLALADLVAQKIVDAIL